MADYNASETPSNILGLVIMGVSVLTIIDPWRGRSLFSKTVRHLPLALVPLYFWYNSLMPARFNIRLDIPFLWALIGVSSAIYLIKLLLWKKPTQPTDK